MSHVPTTDIAQPLFQEDTATIAQYMRYLVNTDSFIKFSHLTLADMLQKKLPKCQKHVTAIKCD